MINQREYRREIAVRVGRKEWIKDTIGGLVVAFVATLGKGVIFHEENVPGLVEVGIGAIAGLIIYSLRSREATLKAGYGIYRDVESVAEQRLKEQQEQIAAA